MLDISHNKIKKKLDGAEFKSVNNVGSSRINQNIIYVLVGLMGIAVVILFLPWRQNIRAVGKVTSMNPAKQTQKIPSVISGRIKMWYKREGDFVSKGDTVVFIEEVKPEYLDPNLIERTKYQIEAKRSKVTSYQQKIDALDDQIKVLTESRALKLEQARNKLKQAKMKLEADSIAFLAEQNNISVAQRQIDGAKALFDSGYKALVDYETKKYKYQDVRSKIAKAESDWIYSQNEVINARLGINAAINEYSEKIAKATSDRSSAFSNLFESKADLNKLENLLENYAIRSGFYYIKAPQDGYITKATKSGLGEVVKEGMPVFALVPADNELAVELYVEPIDLPLIQLENPVRLIFDGWPALVFAGWPGLTSGAFSGKIVAYDKTINEQGKFRIMIAPYREDEPGFALHGNSAIWPEQIRLGTGAYGIALLKQVPVWYEIWRQLNTFPPDFYREKEGVDDKKMKDPIKLPKIKF